MGLRGLLTGLFRGSGMWPFLTERTRSKDQLKAEETRIRAIRELLPELRDGTVVVEAGPGGYFVICTPGAPPFPIRFTVDFLPLGIGGVHPPEIDGPGEPSREIGDEDDLGATSRASDLGAIEVQVRARRRRAALVLIPGAVDGRAVRVFRRGTGTEQAQLADLHTRP